MAVDGTYKIEMSTPRGTQTGTLALKSDGSSLSGSYTTERGAQSFTGGNVTGDEVAWSTTVTGPMGQMKLDYKAKVTGDEISGQVQFGSFGSGTFKGKRV